MAEKVTSVLGELQRELDEFARPAENARGEDEAAVAAMMSLASQICSDDPQNVDEAAQETEIIKMVRSVLAEKPGAGPIAVKYISSDEDVPDFRYLIVLFGERGLLVDRNAGTTDVIALDEGQGSGSEREQAILKSAKTIAVREKLSMVYAVTH